MRITHHRPLIAGIIWAVAAAYVGVLAINAHRSSDVPVKAASGTACSSDFHLMLPTTTTLMGIVNVGLSVPNYLTMPVTSVELRSADVFIGKMQPTTATSYTWAMPWVTSLYAGPTAKTASLVADIYSGGSQICSTAPVQLNVLNSTMMPLRVSTLPPSWKGQIGSSTTMSAVPQVDNYTLDLRPYAKYEWTTPIGNVTKIEPNNAQYSAGFTVGSGNVEVSAAYGGAKAVARIPVTVEPSTAPLPTTTNTTSTSGTAGPNTTSTTSTTGSGATTSTTPTVSPTTLPTESNTVSAVQQIQLAQSNPLIQDCLAQAIGAERYKAINSGQARPSASEIEKMSPCFAGSNYIVPANFAPVEPRTITTLPVSQKAEVHKLENVEKKKGSETITALKISGKTLPNSRVVIYVFSDPLVLTTRADAEGNWTYTLEDPIEAGAHEVYSVVDRGDGVYERSAPVSFVIATAQAASTNPQGLSLRLAETQTPRQSNGSLVFYLVAAAAMIATVVASFLSVFYLKGRRAERRARTLAAVAIPSADAPSAKVDEPLQYGAGQMIAPDAGSGDADSAPDDPESSTEQTLDQIIDKSTPENMISKPDSSESDAADSPSSASGIPQGDQSDSGRAG